MELWTSCRRSCCYFWHQDKFFSFHSLDLVYTPETVDKRIIGSTRSYNGKRVRHHATWVIFFITLIAYVFFALGYQLLQALSIIGRTVNLTSARIPPKSHESSFKSAPPTPTLHFKPPLQCEFVFTAILVLFSITSWINILWFVFLLNWLYGIVIVRKTLPESTSIAVAQKSFHFKVAWEPHFCPNLKFWRRFVDKVALNGLCWPIGFRNLIVTGHDTDPYKLGAKLR